MRVEIRWPTEIVGLDRCARPPKDAFEFSGTLCHFGYGIPDRIPAPDKPCIEQLGLLLIDLFLGIFGPTFVCQFGTEYVGKLRMSD